jgi:PAS domain S-box-containing protein
LKSANILFATSNDEERMQFYRMVKSGDYPYTILFPDSISAVDDLLKDNKADIIVTDLEFNDGAFVDWLGLWPLPFILLVDYSSAERVDKLVKDEASSFLLRTADLSHLRILLVLIRKVLNIAESRARQNAHLRMTEREYLELVQAIPDIVFMLDGKGRFKYVNDAVKELGYRPATLIGKHFSVLLDPAEADKVSRNIVLERFKGKVTGPEGAPKLFDERRSGERGTKNLEIRLIPAETPEEGLEARVNSYGEVRCVGYDVLEFASYDRGTVGIIHDVTARKQNQEQMRELIENRDKMLKEIHHRVKNNLQVISSLLSLQGSTIRDAASVAVFHDCQTQIHAMALVHEQLYRSAEYGRVEMQAYLESLCKYLAGVVKKPRAGIRMEANAEGIKLKVDQAISLALIATELVRDCAQNAFFGESVGTIAISLRKDGADYVLAVRDDGADSGVKRIGEDENSMGTQIIRALIAQLNGSLAQARERGFASEIRFPAKD